MAIGFEQIDEYTIFLRKCIACEANPVGCVDSDVEILALHGVDTRVRVGILAIFGKNSTLYLKITRPLSWELISR